MAPVEAVGSWGVDGSDTAFRYMIDLQTRNEKGGWKLQAARWELRGHVGCIIMGVKIFGGSSNP